MKILQICHKPPLPPVDGGCIAMNNITQGLLACDQQVKVLAVETRKHPARTKEMPLEYLQNTRFESVFIDTTPKWRDAVKTLFNGHSYQISRFYSKPMASALKRILKADSFDIVHLESLYVIPYIPVIRKYSKARIVLRVHNVEHQIWKRLAQNEGNVIRRLVYRVNAWQLERVERRILAKVDGYMPISEPDYQYFKKHNPKVPAHVATFGLNLDNYAVEEDHIASDNPSLFHLGSMNWSPNVEGVEWFLDEVWPEILKAYPDLRFSVAGRGIPDHLYRRTDRNVQVVGAVDSANQFMLSHDIMVVPLLSGSGIRIKIIEAMALGRVVITTSVGAEGLAVENGKHLFIADTPEEFVSIVGKCIATPDLCTIIGENARDFISVYHNNHIIAEHILEFYQKLVAR